MVWWTILGILSVIGYYIFLNRKKNVGKVPIFTSHHEMASLSNEQARVVVDSIIAKGEILIVKSVAADILFLEQLGPTTKDFFSRWSVLETRQGNLRLALEEVKISDYIQDCISIGHIEDWDVVQDFYSDSVFSVEGGEICFGIAINRSPSVYHFILEYYLDTEYSK
jgi:hypothetical protein